MKIHRLKISRGFTLIEIVIAVAIFAVIASIIFPALIQFLDIRERVDRKHDEIVGLQKTFQFMANDLRYAANRVSKNEYGDHGKTTLILNDDNLLEFTAIYPDATIKGLNVPRRVVWKLEDNQLQRVQYAVMDPDGESRAFVQKLLNNVDEIAIEVSFVDNGRDNKSDKWEELNRLPDMIEIDIELVDNTQYRRLFSMQGGDNEAALRAASLPINSEEGESLDSDAAPDNTGTGSS